MCHCIVRNLAGNWGIFSTSDEGFVNFRLRYRKALINYVWEAIRQVGRGNATDTGELLSHSVEDLVPENDRKHFLTIAKEEIAALHEGSYSRYRLRPIEFNDWQKRKP